MLGRAWRRRRAVGPHGLRVRRLRTVVGIVYPVRRVGRLLVLRMRRLAARVVRSRVTGLGRRARATNGLRASGWVGIVSWRLLARALRARGTGESLRPRGIALVVRLKRLPGLLGVGLDGVEVVRVVRCRSGCALCCVTGRATDPARARGAVHLGLVGLRVHVLGQRRARRARDAGRGRLAEELQTGLDVDVGGV